MKSSEEYVVTIPVYDKSKLTGMLLYMDNGEYNKFEFESVNGIMNKTDNFRNNDVDDLMFIFVQGFIRMHEVQYADQHKSANDWIIHQIKNKNLTSNFKNSCGEFCFDATEIDREPDKYSSTGWSAVIINVEKCIPIDCPPNIDAGPSAPSGGLIITIEVDNNSTGGSSDGDGNDDGDNDNKPEPKIKDEECKENNMTSEAVDCINSSNMIFPCEEGTTDDVWDEIVSSLCNNSSGDGDQNTQIEGPRTGKIDCTDVDVELSGHDRIDYGNLEECPSLKCILDDFIDNSSTNSNYLCEMMTSFTDPNNPSILFHFDSGINGHDAQGMIDENGNYRPLHTRPGYTVPSLDNMTIVLNRNICEEGDIWGSDYDNDGIENPDGSETVNGILFSSAVMFHELMHAQMNSWIANLFPDQWQPNLSHTQPPNLALWQAAVSVNLNEPIPGTTPPQHDLMQYFVNQITQSLYDLNGQNGNLEEYEYWARLVTNSVRFDDDYTVSDLLDDKAIFDENIMIDFNCN